MAQTPHASLMTARVGTVRVLSKSSPEREAFMRRFQMCAVVMTVALTGMLSAQAMKIANLDDYKKAMQSLGTNVQAAQKGLASGATADAKTAVGNAKTT